jgi:hypothetical protein
VRIRRRGNVLTRSLLRNGCCLFAYLVVIALQRLYTLHYITNNLLNLAALEKAPEFLDFMSWSQLLKKYSAH